MSLKSLIRRFKKDPPLAWAQLSHQRTRLLVAMMGICFADLLMFTQLGLQSMLNNGSTLLHEQLGGDMYLVSDYFPSLRFTFDFAKAYLYKADAIDGVAQASPLYIGSANWVNPENLKDAVPDDGEEVEVFDEFGAQVRILAFNLRQPVLNMPEVNQQLDKLSAPNAVLYDRFSQPKLGPIEALLQQQPEVVTIMDNQRTYAVGLFSLGSNLFSSGNVVMSDANYAKYYGSDRLEDIAVGVLTLEPSASVEQVKTQLRTILPPEIGIYTRDELIQREIRYQTTDVNGVILNFGAIVGFVVGIIIVYQILYTDVSEHLPEYATLKAMGYSDRSLLFVVLQEALILALLGFLPGFIASLGIYRLLFVLTNIPLTMQLSVAINVFVLTLVMCGISGAIAMRKLGAADPADIF
jgi:putative ABC transport system permease protein